MALIDQSEPAPVVMTWGALIRDIADKDSAHVDVNRPTAWDFIDQYHIGVVPTMPFLLYRLAIAIVDVGSDMLQPVGRPKVITTATASLGGLTCQVVMGHEVDSAAEGQAARTQRPLSVRQRDQVQAVLRRIEG